VPSPFLPMSDSSSDSEEDEMYDASGADRTHSIFNWKDLKHDAEGREEKVYNFCRTLKRQGMVRIILPEELEQTYADVENLADGFFNMPEEEQEKALDLCELKQVQGKLTGFTHARLRQQMETRITGEGVPIPRSSQPAGFEEAVQQHFNLMDGCGRFVLGVCAEGMGVDPAWFYDLLDEAGEGCPSHPSDPYSLERRLSSAESTSASVLRIMQYHHATEPAEEPDGTKVLCQDHLDNGLVTLSFITKNPSLEVHRLDGGFHLEEKRVSGVPTECIVWVGEQMEKISNGYYKPVRHRVLQPSAAPPWYRVAMPFFLRGRPDAIINSATATRIKAKRPGMLRKFTKMKMRDLAGVDAAKALLHDYLMDRRECKRIKALQEAQDQAGLSAEENSGEQSVNPA